MISSPQVDVITGKKIKLAYFEAAVQHFIYYATGTSPIHKG